MVIFSTLSCFKAKLIWSTGKEEEVSPNALESLAHYCSRCSNKDAIMQISRIAKELIRKAGRSGEHGHL